MSDDNVNHPKHYQGSNGIESIQVIEGFDLSYNCGTAAAYIMRADRKGGVEDLKKAVWHLQREIAGREAAQLAAATYGKPISADLKGPPVASGEILMSVTGGRRVVRFRGRPDKRSRRK